MNLLRLCHVLAIIGTIMFVVGLITNPDSEKLVLTNIGGFTLGLALVFWTSRVHP